MTIDIQKQQGKQRDDNTKVSLSKKCYRRHGKMLPKGLNWEEVLDTLPNELYEPSYKNAMYQLITIGISLLVAVSFLIYGAWYLMPVGWLLLGVVMNGLFAVGKDCSEHNWVPSDIVNDIVGIIASVPLINLQLHRRKSLRSLSATGVQINIEKMDNGAMKNVTMWPLLLTLSTFMVTVYQLYAYGGLTALMKWWLLPYCAYSFWHLLGTMMHNAGEKHDDDRFVPTIRYTFPMWLKWLNIVLQYVNVSFPNMDKLHYVPSYHLKSAYKFLTTSDYAPYVSEGIVGITTLKELGRAYIYTVKYWITQRLNWLNVIILFGTPAFGMYGFLSTPLQTKTMIWALIYYFITGFGITLAYHRLWSHRSFKVVWPIELILALFGAGSVQGSIKWWCRNHRIHHRYTDTDYDPYNAQNGFWFAHMGWMLIHPEKKNWAYVDIHDLKQNWIVQLQHKYYLPLVIFFGVLFPTLVAGIGWGDYRGGYFYAGIIRLIFVHHATFCVNSVAHYFGDHTYDDNHTPKDHYITALLTLGEGYHNFHHEFPYDYRNGIRFFDYDPTKWLINLLNVFGLAYDLKTFPSNEIQKGKLTMKQKKLDEEKLGVEWPVDPNELPVWTWNDVKQRISNNGETLIVVDNLVHNIEHFADEHPGGEKLIRSYVGKDATDAFHGGVYAHHAAAKNLLATFRVARLPVADKESKKSK